MNLPSLLLFDLGGVLIESSTFERLHDLLPEPLERNLIKDRWLHSTAVRCFERGEMDASEFAGRFVAEWGLSLSPEDFLQEFASWPRAFFPGARDILRELRKNYRIACLSNSNALHWQRFGNLAEDFDVALFSHLLGVIKPDAEIFMLALRVCDLAPSEICFFDDCAANVHVARSLGMNAFQVDGFNSLKALLRNQGLLS